MNSPFAEIFKAVQNKIKEVTAIKHIDQDLGQLENYNFSRGEKPAVTFPCVLIDVEEGNAEELADNAETVIMSVLIRIAFPPYSATSQAVPPTYRDKALAYYDLEWLINKKLHGWSPIETSDINPTGSLSRKTFLTEKREDNIRVRAVRYTLSMEDYSTKDTVNKVRAALEVNAELLTEPVMSPSPA
jgi:hypothetical protein